MIFTGSFCIRILNIHNACWHATSLLCRQQVGIIPTQWKYNLHCSCLCSHVSHFFETQIAVKKSTCDTIWYTVILQTIWKTCHWDKIHFRTLYTCLFYIKQRVLYNVFLHTIFHKHCVLFPFLNFCKKNMITSLSCVSYDNATNILTTTFWINVHLYLTMKVKYVVIKAEFHLYSNHLCWFVCLSLCIGLVIIILFLL